jgi:3-hydroxyacyl-CoA dehydrogenase/enoyl-CoA hydratase/3-hydroxybutyryl-CoA epimerase
MHYFSPVNKMPLLEVIVTDKTAPWVTATAVEVGKKQGKTVIVVHDGYGFYTSRILGPYMNEAAFVLAEGVRIEEIDAALVDWGFPVGPITLLDEVGIDVAEKAGHIMHDAFGDRISPPDAFAKIIADDRAGRKNNKGFYEYADGKKMKEKGRDVVDESVYGVLGITPGTHLDRVELAERVALQMVGEAIRCLEEGILRSPRDGDIGAIFGLGFPPFRGGPFRYADDVGPQKLLERFRHFEAQYGARWTPPALLVEHARTGKKFHGEGSSLEAAALAASAAAE